MSIDLRVSNKNEPVVGIVLENDFHVHLINFLDKKPINSFDIETDTAQRMAFSISLDLLVIGSWRKGIKCFSLSVGNQLWTSPINGFTELFILESSDLLIVSGHDSKCLVLDVYDGELIEELHEYQTQISKEYLVGIGVRSFNLYKQDFSLIAESIWKNLAIDCFDVDANNTLVIAGPEGVSKFKIGQTGEAQPLSIECERLRDIVWHDRQNRFFGVASFYKDKPGNVLIAFDSEMNRCEVIRELEGVDNCNFVNKGKHLICDTGLVFDLDELRDIDQINWKRLVPEQPAMG